VKRRVIRAHLFLICKAFERGNPLGIIPTTHDLLFRLLTVVDVSLFCVCFVINRASMRSSAPTTNCARHPTATMLVAMMFACCAEWTCSQCPYPTFSPRYLTPAPRNQSCLPRHLSSGRQATRPRAMPPHDLSPARQTARSRALCIGRHITLGIDRGLPRMFITQSVFFVCELRTLTPDAATTTYDCDAHALATLFSRLKSRASPELVTVFLHLGIRIRVPFTLVALSKPWVSTVKDENDSQCGTSRLLAIRRIATSRPHDAAV